MRVRWFSLHTSAAADQAKAEKRAAEKRQGGGLRNRRSIAGLPRLRARIERSAVKSRTQGETRSNIEENQQSNVCPPSPSSSIEESILPSEGTVTAPPDPKKPVYDRGREVLGKSSGGQVTNLIRHHGGDLTATIHTLNLAATKSDPREYIGAILRGDREPEINWDAEYRRLGVS